MELLGLKYVVLIFVVRDDFFDGGVSWFVVIMMVIRDWKLEVKIEVLIVDFWGG